MLSPFFNLTTAIRITASAQTNIWFLRHDLRNHERHDEIPEYARRLGITEPADVQPLSNLDNLRELIAYDLPRIDETIHTEIFSQRLQTLIFIFKGLVERSLEQVDFVRKEQAALSYTDHTSNICEEPIDDRKWLEMVGVIYFLIAATSAHDRQSDEPRDSILITESIPGVDAQYIDRLKQHDALPLRIRVEFSDHAISLKRER